MKLLRSYLLLCLAYLFPHIGEPEEAEPEEPEAESEEEETESEVEAAGEEPEEEESEESEQPQVRQPSRAQREITKLRERTQVAERAAQEAREAVQRLQSTIAPPVDRQLADEDAKLRDPATTEWERWQIQSNRTLRESRHESRQALAHAQDLSDKTEYASKGIANPIYAKYSSRVEKKFAEIRAQGGTVPREVILKQLIGDDMISGNFKAKAPAAKTTIPRGKPTNARSDTPGRGAGSTEHQKRTARLLNTQI